MVKNDGKNAAAKKTARNILNVAAPFITLGVAVLAWAIVAKIVDAEILAPSVKSVFLSVIKLIKSGEFYASAAFTALRAFAAFTISFLSAFLSSFFPSEDLSPESESASSASLSLLSASKFS